MVARLALSALLFLTLMVLHCSDRSAEVTVRWEDPATDKVGYKVERRDGDDGSFQEIAKTPPDVTSVTDNVVLGKLYCYRVGAVQQSGEVAYLDETCRRADPVGDGWTQ